MKWIDNLGKIRTPPRTGWGSLFLAKIRIYQVELLILVGFLFLFALISAYLPAIRVGDGSDYYAMQLAWKTNLKPFMTPESWQAYAALVESGDIFGLMDMPVLKHINLPLQHGQTTDFTHFWFYSFLAFLLGLPFSLLGMPLGLHASFLLLHAFLLSLTWILAYRFYAWKGLAAIALLTFLSPVLWFFDKAHTELFTFCVTTSAVILFLKKRYLPSAFFLSMAAAQNISFAAISGLALLIYLYEHRDKIFSMAELAIVILTVAFNLISPLYTFFRFGVLNPQQLFGYIQLGSLLSRSYIWFVDPDIGMFPHWPLGLFVLIAFGFLASRRLRIWNKHLPLILFLGMYFAASLVAQASTVNINAGGNPGISRYALWYLALFFPAIVLWMDKAFSKRWSAALSLAVILLGGWFNLSNYHPLVDQFAYIRPSRLSYWIQERFPTLYTPPAEIFAERYGGMGENIQHDGYLAVMGPDCRKLLIIDRHGEIVLGGEGCNFERDRLELVVQQKAKSYSDQSLPAYASLTQAEFDASRKALPIHTWFTLTHRSPAAGWLLSGWSYPESWGTWMAQEKAVMRISCPPLLHDDGAYLVLQAELVPLASPNRLSTEVKVYLDRNHAWSGILEEAKQVSVPYSPAACQPDGFLNVHFQVSELLSPQEAGLSDDDRSMGVGLTRFRFLELPRDEPGG